MSSLNMGDRLQKKHEVLKNVWDFFETIPYYDMKPMPDLIDNGDCLANENHFNLVYLEESGRVRLKLTMGLYERVRINAQNPQDRSGVSKFYSGQYFRTPAGGGDWTLLLKKI